MSILAEEKTSNWIMQFTFVSVEGGDLMLMSDLAQSILVKAEFVWLCSLEHESCCLTKAISSRLTKSSTKAIPRVDIKHRGKKKITILCLYGQEQWQVRDSPTVPPLSLLRFASVMMINHFLGNVIPG